MTGHLYFIGIAGHTMRGLALAARDNGYTVRGLDEPAVAPGSDWLDEHNFVWWRTFDPVQLDGVTGIIVTGAHITNESPVIIEANKRNIPVQSYAEFFGRLTATDAVVAVAGTHGKTTTSSLITWLLEAAGKRPDYLIGIRPFNFDSSVRFANSGLAVVEADEYKASSLDTRSKAQYYHPDTLILTAVEHDHPDVFPDLESVKDRFGEIIAQLPTTGHLIACAESETVLELAAASHAGVTTYGLEGGDFRARDIAYLPQGIEFDVEKNGKILGHLAVGLYGRHNVLNALAAVAAALICGLSFDRIISGAATFKGAYRRFNAINDPESLVTVIDDYAHHPTEVTTNLEAAKLHFKHRRVIAVFRPHTYSRTKALLGEYQAAFDAADLVFITDIEGAREGDQAATVSGADIITDELAAKAVYEPDRAKLIEQIVDTAKPGDVILCFTVSGYQNIAQELAQKTQEPRHP